MMKAEKEGESDNVEQQFTTRERKGEKGAMLNQISIIKE